MSNLLRRLFARQRVFLIACTLLLGLFQFLLCAIVASIDVDAAMQQILMFAPPLMRTIIESSFAGSSTGVLAFGWNHPITHAITTAIAVTLGARAVAGEVENGAIELVLAQPITRARYMASNVVFAVVALLLVVGGGVAGTLIGQEFYSLDMFGVRPLLQLLLNMVLLQLAFYAITLLISSFGREAGRVAAAGVLIVVVSYFIDVIGQLWSKAAFIRPYSLHKYYNPQPILLEGEPRVASFIVLTMVFVICTGAAFRRMQTRDLP